MMPMHKRRLVIVLSICAVAIAAVMLMQRRHFARDALAISDVGKFGSHGIACVKGMPSASPTAENAPLVRILELAKEKKDPAEMVALLRKLSAENPEAFFAALMTMGRAPMEIRRNVLPLLAGALTLWPEVEGRDVFPVADSYAEIDLPAAAEWAATFLINTNRSDLAASSLLGRLSEFSEERAFFLVALLPGQARRDAMSSVASHIQIGSLDHLMQLCVSLEPQDASIFSKPLFDRLGEERLDETANWLVDTPGAAQIPGAIPSISQALVNRRGPQKAIAWADSLPDVNAEAQAIMAIYREWAKASPDSAIRDILSADDRTPQLMADVFKGAVEHHGTGAATQWDVACHLENSSARSYAISALIEPMLVAMGPTETKSRVAALPSNSLEREVAELTIRAAYETPSTVRLLESRFGKIE